ncbi:MAG TPA: DoxX family protein [Turneriella sp.]|nr:DoxX family protein [Turneriella sp.]
MTQLIQTIAATQAEWTGLVLRLALAAMILPHGAQKLLGRFGGYGFKGTMGYFTGTAGLPAILAFLVIIGEFFGGLMLLAGFGTRIGALWVGVIMLSAMFMVHWQNGFFMNWYGAQKGEGIEFFILAIGIAAALVISGGGHFSVDALIAG